MEEIKTAYSKLPYRSVFGISKDGRPIYTPMYDGGKTYKDCEVDICNGLEINGHYSYVSTLFHPYVIGCYGKGKGPENSFHQCSTNPRMCGDVTFKEAKRVRRSAILMVVITVVPIVLFTCCIFFTCDYVKNKYFPG